MKTHRLGPAVLHFLTQKLFTENPWPGLAILSWLVNLLQDPNDDSDNTYKDVDASHCLWALYYGRRPDVISLGCIHLLVPLNCAWGVLSNCPDNAADVQRAEDKRPERGHRTEFRVAGCHALGKHRPAAVLAAGGPLSATARAH